MNFVRTIYPVTTVVHWTTPISDYLLAVLPPKEKILEKACTHRCQKGRQWSHNSHNRVQKCVGDGDGVHPGLGS